MNVSFRYHSSRARKIRFAKNLTKTIRLTSNLLATLLIIEGSILIFTEEGRFIGAASLAIAIFMQLPRMWYDYELDAIQPFLTQGDTLKAEEVLSPDVVANLKSIDSPKDLWRGIKKTWQKKFFCIRYHIDESVFEQLDTVDFQMREIWQSAYELSAKYGENRISTAAILVSLLKTVPGHVEILADQGLDLEELESSIGWIHHTEKVLKHKGNKISGGLARDWTSGYTPTLNQIAQNMSFEIEHGKHLHRDSEMHQTIMGEMIKFLSTGRRNVMMVGDVGVGKTSAVYGMVRQLLSDTSVPQNVRYNQVFKLTPGDVIAISQDKTQLESAITRIVVEAQKSKNTILFFDDAYEFFDEGTGSIDISKLLLPIIEKSGVPLIFAMTPQEWQTVAARSSSLAGIFNYLAIPEMDKENSMRVLEDKSLFIEARHKVIVTYQALETAYDLSERYVRELAAPGRAITLLENSINHAQGNIVTDVSVQKTIEATRGVKVQTATGSEKQELLSLEDKIHERMINQSRAVKVVSDALRRARSGVNNPNKPMGTFLFLGPTGVGKTELSKAVAAEFFGHVENIVRVDMNEYTQSSDTSRLLDISSATSLLSAVGRNPFTVVLFDEIEKAHPEVVNVLLQLLDEGVMRDTNNKEVSFKDAIVIATSNAGADDIRAQIEAGNQLEQFEKQFINSIIAKNIFKPEFLNRFDETVLFRPLTVDELVQVVDLLMSSVNKNLARQKVSVSLTPEAKQWLAQAGYDPQFGARPLRRMVQRTVENVVAKRILLSSFKPGTNLHLDAVDLQQEVQ